MVKPVRRERDTRRVDAKADEAIPHVARGCKEHRDVRARALHVAHAVDGILLRRAAGTAEGGKPDGGAAEPLRRRRGQPPLDRTERGSSGKRPRARAGCRAEARVTRRSASAIGALADSVIAIEKLTAMAHQPEVVKRKNDGNPAPREQPDDVGRQARQMMDMSDVRFEFVDQLLGRAVYGLIPICLFEGSDMAERVVDPGDG